MEVLITVSSIGFVVLAVILVILILLQSDKSAGMGILGGSSQTAFGSSTADVITKITTGLVAFFMLGSLGLAVLESYKESSIEKEFETETTTELSVDKTEDKKTEAYPTSIFDNTQTIIDERPSNDPNHSAMM